MLGVRHVFRPLLLPYLVRSSLRFPQHGDPFLNSYTFRSILVKINTELTYILTEPTALVQEVPNTAGINITFLLVSVCLRESPSDEHGSSPPALVLRLRT